MSADLNIILPEILLSVFAMLALLVGVYTGKDRTAPALTWITAGVMALIGLWIALTGEGTNAAFGGMFVDDAFARFAKVTLLLSGAVVLVMGRSIWSVAISCASNTRCWWRCRPLA